jgi:hypothetical protein
MKTGDVLWIAIWMLLFLSLPAYAYLDPGSGSMILQVLLGGVAAIGVAIKIFGRRILEFFRIQKKDESEIKTERKNDVV